MIYIEISIRHIIFTYGKYDMKKKERMLFQIRKAERALRHQRTFQERLNDAKKSADEHNSLLKLKLKDKEYNR